MMNTTSTTARSICTIDHFLAARQTFGIEYARLAFRFASYTRHITIYRARSTTLNRSLIESKQQQQCIVPFLVVGNELPCCLHHTLRGNRELAHILGQRRTLFGILPKVTPHIISVFSIRIVTLLHIIHFVLERL